jgi:hypothetical protein
MEVGNGAFAPDGIISVQEGGVLIQEGADNIDLNTETIDGKDTFHSMAHAVFQTCRWHDDSCLRQLKVRRGQERTFQLTESVSTIMSCPDFANIVDWKIATTILCSCNCPSFEPEFFCVPHCRKEMYAKKENICIWRLDNYTTFYIHVAKASISMNGG